MSTLLRFCLLLGALSTLVSSKTTPLLTPPAVYNNCSGNNPISLPTNTASTSYFKPQLRVKKNGIGWEEWVFLAHNRQADGSELVYSYKWALGDPTVGNVSQHAFTAWAYFPGGASYNQVVYGDFKYEEHSDGGFTYSIGKNRLTWDPVHDIWHTSVNAGGWIIETNTENVEPGIPYAPSYKSVLGQVADGFFSRIDIPRGHTDGYMTFPWGLNVTIQSVGTLKHSWSNKVIADTVSSYIRGSTFLPSIPPLPIATVNWYQVWDNSGKEIDSMQFLVQPDNSPEGQVFRLQVTDVPEILSIATTPKSAPLSLALTSTELAVPMCGSGVDFEKTDQKMTWKATAFRNLFNLVDRSGGVTSYQEVNMTGSVWFNGAPVEIVGGVGVVEVYRRYE